MKIKTISNSGNEPKTKNIGFVTVYLEEDYTNKQNYSISFDDYVGTGKDYKKRENMKITINKNNKTLEFNSAKDFIDFIFDIKTN